MLEKISFTNWVMPTTQQLKQEFKIEHELKGNNFFESEKDFLDRCKSADTVVVTPSMNSKISYRSNTSSFDELHDLISGYRSYPKYRNEDTLKAIYTGFEKNLPMDMPIVIKFKNGALRVFAGNTRMDIAFQLGINPKVLMVNSDVNY